MKGAIVEKAGEGYKVVDTVEKPTPGKNQILVKSLVTGLNPVEALQQGAGMLVDAWPIVLGCDASGPVVEVGEGVTKFKVGDTAFGCTRLGVPGYGTFQEFFLMDEKLAFTTKTLTMEQAATVGVGLLTSSLGLLIGLKAVLDVDKTPTLDEWLIVLGGAGSVGQYAVQVAKRCGYKVLASCSPGNDAALTALGADATFNYKNPLDQQLQEIKSITNGKFSRVFDAAAMSTETGLKALASVGDANAKVKYFATTNGWEQINPVEGVEIYRVALERIGKERNADDQKDNADIMAMIPILEKCLEQKSIKPMEYEIVDGEGVENVLKGIEEYNAKKGTWKKVVVRVAAA